VSALFFFATVNLQIYPQDENHFVGTRYIVSVLRSARLDASSSPERDYARDTASALPQAGAVLHPQALRFPAGISSLHHMTRNSLPPGSAARQCALGRRGRCLHLPGIPALLFPHFVEDKWGDDRGVCLNHHYSEFAFPHSQSTLFLSFRKSAPSAKQIIRNPDSSLHYSRSLPSYGRWEEALLRDLPVYPYLTNIYHDYLTNGY
jgi:hypothetical protein